MRQRPRLLALALGCAWARWLGRRIQGRVQAAGAQAVIRLKRGCSLFTCFRQGRFGGG